MRRRQFRHARTALCVAFSIVAGATVVANRTTVAQAQRLDAVSVGITADGTERQLRTAQTTVGAILKDAGIKLGPADLVFPKANVKAYNGMEIKVVRVSNRVVVETQPIAFKTITKVSAALRTGMTEVSSEGLRGEKHLVYSVRSEDGKETKRKLLNAKLVKKPVDRVILVGSRGLMTSRGLIETRKTLKMSATAYDPGPRSCGRYATGRTSTGMRAGYGVVAVDPRYIPLGSRLYVEGYGFAIAGDTGSAIRGHKIDLGYSTHRAAMRFGRKRVTVHVLK